MKFKLINVTKISQRGAKMKLRLRPVQSQIVRPKAILGRRRSVTSSTKSPPYIQQPRDRLRKHRTWTAVGPQPADSASQKRRVAQIASRPDHTRTTVHLRCAHTQVRHGPKLAKQTTSAWWRRCAERISGGNKSSGNARRIKQAKHDQTGYSRSMSSMSVSTMSTQRADKPDKPAGRRTALPSTRIRRRPRATSNTSAYRQ